MTELIQSIFNHSHDLIYLVNSRVMVHLDKIESNYSAIKNLQKVSKFGRMIFIILLFLFKSYLLKAFKYVNNDKTLMEDKEYMLLMLLMTIFSFSITSESVFTETKTLSTRKLIGLKAFKILINSIKTFKTYFFFEKFKKHHREIFNNIENEFSNDKINIIISILAYFLFDFFLLNSTSTISSLYTYFASSTTERNRILYDLFNRLKLFCFYLLFILFSRSTKDSSIF